MRSDHEIIKAFQNGNQSAFDELVRRYLPQVYQFFAAFTKDEMEADDLAQEVFLKLYKSLGKFRFEAEFSTYLYRINVNQANSYFRRNRWRNLLHLDEVPEVETPHVDANRDFDTEQLWTEIGKLPKRQRMIMMLRVGQKMPYSDIAGILDMSVNSAKVNYHHAVNNLKQKLGQN